jgi:hypothetical protein
MMKYINRLLTGSLDRTYLKRLCDHEVTKQINASQQEIIDHIIEHSHHATLDEMDFNIKYFF